MVFDVRQDRQEAFDQPLHAGRIEPPCARDGAVEADDKAFEVFRELDGVVVFQRLEMPGRRRGKEGGGIDFHR
jgi:hypothetical protein